MSEAATRVAEDIKAATVALNAALKVAATQGIRVETDFDTLDQYTTRGIITQKILTTRVFVEVTQ